ncbi:chloride channel protein [Aestuariivirga sp.]|uniref:chloride channel protein n=1 Tax=Aestuariivirga sp. TaxID=2650926 RepID=UPI003BA9E5F8
MGELTIQMHHLLFGVPITARLSGAYVPSTLDVFLWLGLGGLLLGFSNVAWKRFGRGDILDPIEANALYGGRMDVGSSLFVAGQAAIANGVGGSVGIEGGFTQLASALGSWLGRLLGRSRDDVRLLVACGAAGAIAGAFNAPFAGIAYAFELILAAYSPSVLAPIVLASIGGKYAASLTAGHGYRIVLHGDLSAVDHSYLWAVAIGLLCGLFAILLMYAVTMLERWLSRTHLPMPIITATGGLATAGVAVISPHVMGSGHGGIDFIFANTLSAMALGSIFLLKLLACTVSIGSGFRGGLFSASLFLGALLGGAIGTVVVQAGFMPNSALLGMQVVAMSAFGGAVVGTPMAMAILAAEITAQIGLMPEVLLAVIVATLVVRTLFGYSFSIWRLHVRGSPARSAADIAWARTILMREIMRPDVVKFPDTVTCGELLAKYPPGSIKWVVLVDAEERYMGLCDVAEVAFSSHSPDQPVSAFAHQKSEVLSVRQSLEDAILWFETPGREVAAVVNSLERMEIAGIVTESYVLKRYAQELERRRQH